MSIWNKICKKFSINHMNVKGMRWIVEVQRIIHLILALNSSFFSPHEHHYEREWMSDLGLSLSDWNLLIVSLIKNSNIKKHNQSYI